MYPLTLLLPAASTGATVEGGDAALILLQIRIKLGIYFKINLILDFFNVEFKNTFKNTFNVRTILLLWVNIYFKPGAPASFISHSFIGWPIGQAKKVIVVRVFKQTERGTAAGAIQVDRGGIGA